MNRLFNRGRNYKMLSLLMAFVMLFSLLPSSIVNAEAQIVATATTLAAESGNGFVNDETTAGKVVYDPAGATLGKLRARVEFPTDYVPTLGDEVTINYETNIPSFSAEFGYDYDTTNARTMTSDQASLTFSLDENDLAWFANNTTGYEAAIRFKQSSCPEGSYLAVSSVTVTRDVNAGDGETGNGTGDGDNGGNAGGTEAGGITGEPTVTGITSVSSVTDVTSEYEGALAAVRFTPAGGAANSFKVGVQNHDVTQYTKAVIEITPYRAGMPIAVYNNGGCYDGWWFKALGAAEKQTIEIDLTDGDVAALTNISELQLYLDNAPLDTTKEVDVVIHSIKFVKNGENAGSSDQGGNEGGDNGGNAGGTEDGGITGEPTVTGITSVSGVTDVTSEYEGALAAVRFTPAGGAANSFKVGVQNHDVTQYTKAVIEITPYRAGMPIAVYNNGGCYDGWWFKALGAAEKQTIEINLTDGDAAALTNISELQFYLDNAPLDTTKEVDVVIHSIKLINPNAPVKPEAPAESEVSVVLKKESADFALDAEGHLYSATGGKLRGALDFPADFRVEVGGKLAINYDTDLPTFKAEFTYGNGGKPTSFTKEFKAGQNTLVIDIDEAWVAYFAGNDDYTNNPTRARLKVDSTTGTYIDIISVIYTPPTEGGEEGGNVGSESGVPSWQVNNGPTVTLDTNSSVFACEVNSDKSVDVSFNAPAGWTALRANVENCDYTKYSRVKIDITPAEGLYLYVYGDVDGDISGKYDFDSAKRTTIEFDLKRDTAYFDLWCNPQEGTGTAGQKDFTIHSIKIVDPTMPEGEKINAVLSVQEGNFTQIAPDTISGTAKTKMRGKIELPFDFRVEEGKILTIGYETNIPDITVELAYGYEGFNDAMNVALDTDKKSFAYTIDANWIKYINEKENGKVPTLRLKQNEIPADGYFTLKYVVYGEVQGNQYNPEQVPQGLVVTYYNDIYSRGVAWNTDNTVEENALYYVKATDGMTAENIDWTSGDVQKIDATSKDTTDTTGKTWRTFKAHVENLDAGAKYFYRAGNEETGWSEVGSFTIEKAKEEITGLSFIHVTDSQEESSAGFQKWARVLKEAYTKDPNAAFVAHTGDIVNRSENKNNFYMSEWMYAFDEPMSQIMNGVFAPASGNHETLDYVFTDRFDIQWADYKEGDEELRYGGCYTVTYGEPENGLVLISLNNTAEAWNYDTDFKLYQQVWLVEQLEKYNDYKWKVVQLHEGLMTAGDHTNDGEVETMRDALPPIFAKYKVDLVLQGHDHVYTRTRSYAYGENVFEPGTEENPNYFNGHTPVWTETQTLEPGETSADGSVTNNLDRTIYLEPQGTHYITINSCGTKQYPEEPADRIDEVIFEGDNPIHPTDENGNYGSMCQPGLPMYGIVSIEGDLLIYDSYTYDHNTRTSDLYDSFAVSKANKSGYNTDNPHEGKEEVQLYGITMESKNYDGYAPKLDVSRFIASDPRVMDVTAFKYTITSANDDGASYYQSAKGELFYGSNGKGIIPTQKGDYVLTVEIPQSNRYFYGSTTVEFSIK